MVPLASKMGLDGSRAVNFTCISIKSNDAQTVSSREIIVRAGALESPKLLMLSGIGIGRPPS